MLSLVCLIRYRWGRAESIIGLRRGAAEFPDPLSPSM